MRINGLGLDPRANKPYNVYKKRSQGPRLYNNRLNIWIFTAAWLSLYISDFIRLKNHSNLPNSIEADQNRLIRLKKSFKTYQSLI